MRIYYWLATISHLYSYFHRLKKYNIAIRFATNELKIKELIKLYYFRSITQAEKEKWDEAKKDDEDLKNLFPEKYPDTEEGAKYVAELNQKGRKHSKQK